MAGALLITFPLPAKALDRSVPFMVAEGMSIDIRANP